MTGQWRNDILAFDMLVHRRMQDLLEMEREDTRSGVHWPSPDRDFNLKIRWHALLRNEGYALYL